MEATVLVEAGGLVAFVALVATAILSGGRDRPNRG